MSLGATPTPLPPLPLPPPPFDPLPPLPLDGWITLVNRAYVIMQKDGKAVDQFITGYYQDISTLRLQ